MTSSAGASGLIFAGSPPRSFIASRMVARSTTHGTPVKSCMITRAGVNWISSLGSAAGSHDPSARIWSAVTLAPSSVRSRFSSSTLCVNGSRAEPSTASTRKISYVVPPTSRSARAPKLSLLAMLAISLRRGSAAAAAHVPFGLCGRSKYLDVKILHRSLLRQGPAGSLASARAGRRRQQQRHRLDVVGHGEQVERPHGRHAPSGRAQRDRRRGRARPGRRPRRRPPGAQGRGRGRARRPPPRCAAGRGRRGRPR